MTETVSERFFRLAKELLPGGRDQCVGWQIAIRLATLEVAELKEKTPDRWNLASTEGLLFNNRDFDRTADVVIGAGLLTEEQFAICQRLWIDEEARRRPADAPEHTLSTADLRRDIETRARPPQKPRQTPPEPPRTPSAPPARVLTPQPRQKPPQAPQTPPEPPAVQTPAPAPETPPSAPPATVAASQRKPRPGESTDAFGDAIIEHFTCVKCGSTFTRPKTRGRKPRLCSACLSPSRRKRRRT